MRDAYAAITAHTPQFPVRLMCRALGVAVSGYYAAHRRPPSARAMADERLRLAVHLAFRARRARYGAPRVHADLRDTGVVTSEKRIARLMRDDQLVARRRRRFVVTTDSDHQEAIAPNHVARAFAPTQHPVPDRVWVGDMTYVPTRTGWVYLAGLLDLTTRLVVGWATARTPAAALPLTALDRAVIARRPRPGLVVHADRGCQYASQAYRAALAPHGAIQTISRRGDCWDIAVAENFFATLEHELVVEADLHARHEAEQAVFEFIDAWYNRQRRHPSLGQRSLRPYERQLSQPTRSAA